MNKQRPDSPNAIHWTRIKLPDGTCTNGYTWNVFGGCNFQCRWLMPNDDIAICYAKETAEGFVSQFYPHGFEHHYFHPARLEEPLSVKKPAGIFLDSMSDMMGTWGKDHEIEKLNKQVNRVLDVCREASRHTFFLLTKNAPRLTEFKYTDNVWVGVSSPADFMNGKKLTRDQQEKMLTTALISLSKIKVPITWMSFEPLSWAVDHIVKKRHKALKWAVIGAASNGRTKYPPDEDHLRDLVEVLDNQGVPIYFKGNLKSSPWAVANWREDFPTTEETTYHTRDQIARGLDIITIVTPISTGYRCTISTPDDETTCTRTDNELAAWGTGNSPDISRYTYLGDNATDESLVGLQCDPVKNDKDKCVVSTKMATALVEDEDGKRNVVKRRRLRLNEKLNKIYNMPALDYLKDCKADSVHCMVTSPPYWGLRDYGTDPIPWPAMKYAPMPGIPEIKIPAMTASLGQEPTLESFIGHLVLIFRESLRVLHPTGTVWLNMGDCYATSANGRSAAETKSIGKDDRTFRDKPFGTVGNGLKPKDLVMQPARLALALQADGWYLRSDIIWNKTNAMPESVNDRPTTNHEHVFLLAKSPRYYYDKHAIAEPVKQSSIERLDRGVSDHHKNLDEKGVPPGSNTHSLRRARANGEGYQMPATKNKRTVWTISTKGFPDAHFATFPEALIEPMVLAGCPPKVCPTCLSPWQRITEKEFVPQEDVSLERGIKGAPGQKPQYEENQWGGTPRGTVTHKTTGWQPTCTCQPQSSIPGTVLDMFMGSGTTALVAKKNGRNYMGCDNNAEYVKMATDRLAQPIQSDMFASAGVATNRFGPEH